MLAIILIAHMLKEDFRGDGGSLHGKPHACRTIDPTGLASWLGEVMQTACGITAVYRRSSDSFLS